MCLVCDFRKYTPPSIAEKDIVVYKLLWVKKSFFGIFKQYYGYFYRGFRYRKNKIAKSDLRLCSRSPMFPLTVEEGLHTFKFKEDANVMWDNYVVAKMIIPKGSEYYMGKFGKAPCYASNQLKLISICE